VTRIEAARRRASGAKQIAVAVAAAGFLATLLLARVSHPGQAATSSSSGATSQSRSQSSSSDSFDYGSASVAPSSSSSLQAQTSVS
jgi:hypothetical protein